MRETYKLTRKTDPRIGWILLGIFVGIIAVFVIVGLLLGRVWFFVPIGVALGLLAAVVIFGRRAERSAYAQIEGQPGAAAAVLKSLKSGWFVTPALTMNKNQDVVHRVLGRPGVILR